ncbi:unnamed protein product [Penicillium viridicatum]
MMHGNFFGGSTPTPIEATASFETMDPARRQALKHARTIFLSDGQPHYENLSALPEMWWVSVKLSVADRLFADEELNLRKV